MEDEQSYYIQFYDGINFIGSFLGHFNNVLIKT